VDILEDRRAQLLADIAQADAPALEAIRVAALGKSGTITALLKTLGAMTPEQRQAEGPAIHALREAVTTAIASRKAALDAAVLEARLASERIDLTLPASPVPTGSIHPVSQVMEELAEIFADLGFAVATGPEIEDDWHNFTALNIPETHPAGRCMTPFMSSGPGRRPRTRRTSGCAPRRPEKHPRSADASPHPHLPRPDPHHDDPGPADPDHRARPHLPLRQRRDPHPDVPPGGGPRHRSRHHLGPSQMDARDFREGVFRAR
jgi:hypothetical protein